MLQFIQNQNNNRKMYKTKTAMAGSYIHRTIEAKLNEMKWMKTFHLYQ